MKATMLTSAKIVLISILFISLPFGSYEKENLGRNATESTAKEWKLRNNVSLPQERKVVHLDNEKRNDSNPKPTDSPRFDVSSLFEPINSTSNLSRESSSEIPRLISTLSISPPLAHGIVTSRLPLNSSLIDENPLSASTISNSLHTKSLENITWSLDNDTIKTPDISSPTVSILTPAPTVTHMTPLTMEPTGWLTTNSDSFAGFTPYQEKTTLQPTIKFTNNSNLFPNTSDSQKENRSTGIVFGAILGAILGASLLSLVGYLLCGKKKTDSFSHRRLYDDRNEPVLRLDNAPEPYDVSFGSSSYYNSTVNASSMPGGGENGPDSIPMDDIPPIRASI